MFQTATSILDWLGIIAFTATGALVASRKQMDVVGFIVLGTVTGIGGGTLRDVLLGFPRILGQRASLSDHMYASFGPGVLRSAYPTIPIQISSLARCNRLGIVRGDRR